MFGEGAESPGGQSRQHGKGLNASTTAATATSAAEDLGPQSGSQASPAVRKSPAGNRRADGAGQAPPEEEEEVVKDRTQQSKAQPPQPSTGPASRAARGSSTSIPFIDCSDVDSEYDLLREQVPRSGSQTNDNCEGDLTSGVCLLSRDERQGEARHRASPRSARSSRPHSREFLHDDSADVTFDMSRSTRLPRHSSLIDEIFKGSAGHSPLATPLSPSSSSSSPSMSWDRTGSQGYISENGHDPREGVGEDPLPDQGPCYENSSPIPSRPYLRTLPSRYNKSETDPLILSQLASTPDALGSFDDHDKGRQVKTAASPGRRLANGTPVTSPTSRIPTAQSVRARGREGQLAPLQVTEGSTSSGSESSDSDSEAVSPAHWPLTFGNPAVLRSPAKLRSRVSVGGPYLSGEREEEE